MTFSCFQSALIGKYRVVSLISDNGQSPVFLCKKNESRNGLGNESERQIKESKSMTQTPLNVNDMKERFFAVKIVDRTQIDSTTLLHLEHELRIHSFLHHENIVELVDVVYEKDFIGIVTEYCEVGDMLSFVLSSRFTPKLALTFALDILDALEYLHAKGIAHLDIKPENILISADLRAKICDFGCAENVNCFDKENILGTFMYMAPEILPRDSILIQNMGEQCDRAKRLCEVDSVGCKIDPVSESALNSRDPRKCDIWAFGVTFYAMLTKKMPWIVGSEAQIAFDISRAHFIVPTIPLMQLEVITRCLQTDPSLRPTVADIKHLDFFSQFADRKDLAADLHQGIKRITSAASDAIERCGYGRGNSSQIISGRNSLKSSNWKVTPCFSQDSSVTIKGMLSRDPIIPPSACNHRQCGKLNSSIQKIQRKLIISKPKSVNMFLKSPKSMINF